MRILAVLILCVVLAGCATDSPGGVTEKVLIDFGIREKPEGYITTTDKVMAELGRIGEVEIKRLNMEDRQGEILFQRDGEFKGKYYKQRKVYEGHAPLEARATSQTSGRDKGYVGYIEYRYRLYEGPRQPTRTQAEAESASLGTDETGVEVYRYQFTGGGRWNGGEGERARL